jgi:hypothetical protein
MVDARALAGFLAAALLLSPPVAWADPVITAAVQASGELPGFVTADAGPWLAAQMEKAGLDDWRFAPRNMDSAAPDRVEWQFDLLPYAGGQVRQFVPLRGTQMMGTRHLVQAQAKLYLKGEYQTIILNQEVVSGGADDPVLSAFIQTITKTLDSAYHAIDMTPAVHHGGSP